ncbi:MAG: radical SAM protein [Candidatus Aureabacteria bacterium]|nr:radical SAM protein [Candidatus Auribacterota bacterium]
MRFLTANGIIRRSDAMINVTKLYCGGTFAGDRLRYAAGGRTAPVVAWNCTARCNLCCRHCYSDAGVRDSGDELNGAEARRMIADLARYGVPVLLFSGGEPLLRPDLMELGAWAAAKGIRTVLSTNGTLIGKEEAAAIRGSGFSYVGISLDGVGSDNDRFRGMPGAFQKAVEGMRRCLNAGIKTGLRVTLTRQNRASLEPLLDLAQTEGLARVCVYHLVYCGRGMAEDDLAAGEVRGVMDIILRRAREFHSVDREFEILTVDNHADGVYLYLRLRAEEPARAVAARALLENAGGNRSAIGIACVDASGAVYPDQFMRQSPVGSVRERLFSEIWSDAGNALLAALRDRKGLLRGKCGRCSWKEICNGNMRARALAVHGDLWAEDPACYLTEEEIAGAR